MPVPKGSPLIAVMVESDDCKVEDCKNVNIKGHNLGAIATKFVKL